MHTNHHNKIFKTLLVIHIDRMLNVQTIFKLTKTSKRNAKHINLLYIYALIYDVCCDLEMHAQHIFLYY